MLDQLSQQQRDRIEAQTFRRLLSHLDSRRDAQNIDLMNLSGFCRNCLSKWLAAEAEQEQVELSVDDAKTYVYKMPYQEWKDNYQK